MPPGRGQVLVKYLGDRCWWLRVGERDGAQEKGLMLVSKVKDRCLSHNFGKGAGVLRQDQVLVF